MNLAHLAIFHAVAEERSISRGADRLMISQPAVSKQIRLLEQNLRATLLERTPRGVNLTSEGELLAGYARKLFAVEAEAIRALEELQGLSRGHLAIGASTTIGVYLLPELLVKFRQQYPVIDTTLEIASSRGIEQRLIERGIDVGFIESPPSDPSLIAVRFLMDDLVPIVPPNHALLTMKRIRAEQFYEQPFISRSTGSDTKSFVERELASRGVVVKPVLSLGSNEAVKRAVAAGIGVAIVSRLSIGMELKAGVLAVLRPVGLSIRRPLYRITRRESTASRAMEKLMAMLDDHCKGLASGKWSA